MKYAVIGASLSGNKGAAAMLESTIQKLSEKDSKARFIVLTVYPSSDSAQNAYPNVRIMDASPLRLGVLINSGALVYRVLPFLRRFVTNTVPEVAAIAGSDVLLDEGGITFVDGRGKFLIYNVATLLPALFTKTPIVKIAQALGPFSEVANRFSAKVLLPRMQTIVSRGRITREHLETLGLRNVESGADLAFTLDVGEEAVAEARAIAGDFFESGDVVGFSPSQVLYLSAEKDGRDYVAEVVEQIDYLTGTLGKKVLIVPHSARAGTQKTHNNDLPVCRAIVASLANRDRVLFADAELSAQALRELISYCDLFVASRFHAMVSSLGTGVPTLVIGWSHKYLEVLEVFGQAEYSVNYKNLNLALFRERFAELDKNRKAIREEIAAVLPAVSTLANAQIDIAISVAAEGRS